MLFLLLWFQSPFPFPAYFQCTEYVSLCSFSTISYFHFCIFLLLCLFFVYQPSFPPSVLFQNLPASQAYYLWIVMLSALIAELTHMAFIFPSFYFFFPLHPLSVPRQKKSQFLLPFSTSLEITWTFLSLLSSHPSAAPPWVFAALFPPSISQQICLICHLAGYWAFQSPPSAVVWEHLIYTKIRISLLFSPFSFTNDAKKVSLCCGVLFSSSASSFPAPP